MSSNKNTILHVTDKGGLGGGETNLLNQLKFSNQIRFTPIVVCPTEGQITEKLDQLKIRKQIVPFKPVERSGKIFFRFPVKALLKFCSIINKEKINIVHANDFHSMVVTAIGAKLNKIPIVWTCHGWWPTGKHTGVFINHFADKVIAVSGFVKNKLMKEGFVNPNRIIQIPLGVDLSKYSELSSGETVRHEFRIGKDVPLIGMIGRFQKIKGHHIFVNMAIEISRTNPNVHFMIVGSEVFGNESESDYGREIQDSIMKDGLNERIILTGFRHDIPQILKALDVLVVPSEVETFGMVVVEAMAAGVPVVSCAKGGPEEIINDGESGFLIPKQDPVLLSQKVLYLLDNPHVKKAMGLCGKQTVSRKYRIEDQVKKIEFLYTQLAGSKLQ